MKKIYMMIILAFALIMPLYAQNDCWQWEHVDLEQTDLSHFFVLDIYFLPQNSNHGWAVGQMEYLYNTTDRGLHWIAKKITLPSHSAWNDYEFEHVFFIDDKIGFISGSGDLFKTVDGGDSWIDITPPWFELNSQGDTLRYYFEGSAFVDANNGVVVGSRSVRGPGLRFCKTTDGGKTWNLFNIERDPDDPTSPMRGQLTDVILYDKDGLSYAVSDGRIWRSLDGGRSYQIYSRTAEPEYDYQEELDIKGNTFLLSVSGYGIGYDGGMRWSTDRGITWSMFKTPAHIYGVCLLDENRAWAAGLNKQVYYTSDAGKTWTLSVKGIKENIHLDDIYFFDDTTGFVGGRGGLYRYVRTPKLSVAGNQLFCEGDEITLVATDNFLDYTWSNGAKGPVTFVKKAGKYWVAAMDHCNNLIYSDTIEVANYPTPKLEILQGAKQELCTGDTLTLTLNTDAKYISWPDGTSAMSLQVTKSGKYIVKGESESGCVSFDTIDVVFAEKPSPIATLKGNSHFCKGDSAVIELDKDYYEVEWRKEGEPDIVSKSKSFVIKESGKYTVRVKQEYGCWSDFKDFAFNVIVDSNYFEVLDKEIDFGYASIRDKGISKVKVKNTSNKEAELTNSYFTRNISFTATASQFPIKFQPGEVKEVTVVYAPHSLKREWDTLVIEDNCTAFKVAVQGEGEGGEYSSESPCGTEIILRAIDLKKGPVLSLGLPSPNPARENATVNFSWYSLDKESPLISAELINQYGEKAAFGIIELNSANVNEDYYKFDYTMRINLIDLTSGAYYIKITTCCDIKFMPLLIEK